MLELFDKIKDKPHILGVIILILVFIWGSIFGWLFAWFLINVF